VNSLPVIDYVFLVLVLLLVIRCTLRGFIAEFMTLASLVLGALGALFLYRSCAVFLRKHGLENMIKKIPEIFQKLLPGLVQNIPEIISFVLIFVLVFLIVKLVEHLLQDIVQRIKLGAVDRFLGFLFGLAEAIAVISLVLLVIRIQPVFDSGLLLDRSFFADLLFPIIIRRGSSGPEPAIVLVRFVCLKMS
jgi:membrane protein required for colicin V production